MLTLLLRADQPLAASARCRLDRFDEVILGRGESRAIGRGRRGALEIAIPDGLADDAFIVQPGVILFDFEPSGSLLLMAPPQVAIPPDGIYDDVPDDESAGDDEEDEIDLFAENRLPQGAPPRPHMALQRPDELAAGEAVDSRLPQVGQPSAKPGNDLTRRLLDQVRHQGVRPPGGQLL